jgi:hypothetical protein
LDALPLLQPECTAGGQRLDELQYQMDELEELTAGFKRQQRVLCVQPAHCRGYSAWSGQLRGVGCGGAEITPICRDSRAEHPGGCSFHCLGALSTAWELFPLPGCSIHCLGALSTAVAGAFHCLGALSTAVAGAFHCLGALSTAVAGVFHCLGALSTASHGRTVSGQSWSEASAAAAVSSTVAPKRCSRCTVGPVNSVWRRLPAKAFSIAAPDTRPPEARQLRTWPGVEWLWL